MWLRSDDAWFLPARRWLWHGGFPRSNGFSLCGNHGVFVSEVEKRASDLREFPI